MKLLFFLGFSFLYWWSVDAIFPGIVSGGLLAYFGLSLVTGSVGFFCELYFLSHQISLPIRGIFMGVLYFFVFSFLGRIIALFSLPSVSLSYGTNFSFLIILFGIFTILHTIVSLMYRFSYDTSKYSSRTPSHH